MEAIKVFLGKYWEFLFSGVGIVLLGWIWKFVFGRRRKANQKQKSGSNSVNLQSGRDIVIGSTVTPSAENQQRPSNGKQQDASLFCQIVAKLRCYDTVSVIRAHDFAGDILYGQIESIPGLLGNFREPHYRFLDEEMEQERVELGRSASAFWGKFTEYTGPNKRFDDRGWLHGFLPAFRREYQALFRDQATEINEAATELSDVYGDFVGAGMRVLGVSALELEAATARLRASKQDV